MLSFYHQLTGSWGSDGWAVRGGATEVSWSELRIGVARARGWLADRGVAPGDVVAIRLHKEVALLQLHLACLSVGVATLPLDVHATRRELHQVVDDAAPVLWVLEPVDLTGEEPLPAPDPPGPGALALICTTSGTTGPPKGACLTHGNLAASVEALHHAWGWSRSDVLLHALPLNHIHGLVVAQYGALRAGASTVWMGRFDAVSAANAVAEHGVTVLMGVPTFHRRLLDLPSDFTLRGLRLVTSGSAPLPAADLEAFERRFGHRILERYGMTEIGIVLSNPLHGERRPGSVGLPLPGVAIRIDDGELLVGGPSVFGGYLGRPDATAATLDGGWMRTGDLATRDPDGYVRIVGRRKDIVITGGHNVAPGEVEAVLCAHPAVAEASAVGAPDPDLGERVVATVVVRHAVETGVLDAFARERLAGWKCPRAYAFATALPRNPMGKVDKQALRDGWAVPIVRDARPEEAAHIAAWNRAMATETEGISLDPDVLLAATTAVFEHGHGAFYLRAEVAGQVAGQAMITTEWSDWRNRIVWWLQSVYVAPPWRKRGVYRAMHQAVLERARAAGAAGLRLYVDRRNASAAQTYRKVGMEGDHYVVFEQMFGAGGGTPTGDGP